MAKAPGSESLEITETSAWFVTPGAVLLAGQGRLDRQGCSAGTGSYRGSEAIGARRTPGTDLPDAPDQ
jgi:hypothetical protein